MNIEILREYVELGMALNFSKASKALHLDQSTLSRHLQSMEGELGVSLVNRTSASVSLTPAGEYLLGASIDLLSSWDAMVQQAKAIASSDAVCFAVGGEFSGGGIIRLLSFVKAYLKRQQDPVALSIQRQSDSSWSRLSSAAYLAMLEKGEVDVSLVFASEGLDWGGLHHRELFRDRLVLCVSEQHPLAKEKSVSIVDLEPHVVRISAFFEEGNRRLDELCEARGFALKKRTMVVGSAAEWHSFYGPEDAFVINESTLDVVPPRDVSGLVTIPFSDNDAYLSAQAVWRPESEGDALDILLEALEKCADALNNYPSSQQ